jgi:hypothetical protein
MLSLVRTLTMRLHSTRRTRDTCVRQDSPDYGRAGGSVCGCRCAIGCLRDGEAGRHRGHGIASSHRSRERPRRTVVPRLRPIAVAADSESSIQQTPIRLAGVRSVDACGPTRRRNPSSKRVRRSNRVDGDTTPPARMDRRGRMAFESTCGRLQPSNAGTGVPAVGARRFRRRGRVRMSEHRAGGHETPHAETSNAGLRARVSE